jgi:hypothetical protein
VDLLSRVLALTDNTRLSDHAGGRPEHYKEWHHFCVIGPEVEAVINFSVLGDNRPAAAPGARQARVILLARDRGWQGEVLEIPWQAAQVNPGRIDLRFGQQRLAFENGEFHLSVALENQPVTADLRIRPLTYPLLRSRAPIGHGAIDWLVVPRLEASGTLVVGRRVHRLQAAPTYHDHNWGHWLWGQDFAWEWGFALPVQGAAPWSLVFDRVTNRARSHVQELKLSLWKGDRLVRIFAHREITARPHGFLSQGKVPKFPPIMALIAPELTTDVPRQYTIEAASGLDHLSCHFESLDVAQIVIPNETDLGETVINEVIGRIRAEGQLKGERIEIEGKGFFEFLA